MAIERLLRIGDRKILYRVLGKGPAVVLLHGVPADGELWAAQISELAGRTLIVPDLPGSGQSDLVADMSMEGMAEVVKNILEFEKIQQATLIGHSMGGYISLAFAERYPELLTGLGLFHSTAYPDSSERREARLKGIEFIRRNSAYEFLKTSIPNLFAPATGGGTAPDVSQLIAKSNNFSGPALVSYYQAMMQRPDRTTVLAKATVPVLFIAGKYDSVVPLDDSLKQCHLPEKAYFHILAGSAHMGMIEEKEKTNSILNDYLLNLS